VRGPNNCAWCDAPTQPSRGLCLACDAVNSHPPTACAVNPNHLHTLGPVCAECDAERQRRERIAAANAPIIAQLEAIRVQHVADFGRPWPGCDFGKTHVGLMIDGALANLRGDLPASPPPARRGRRGSR
jgi:hypothetical protein